MRAPDDTRVLDEDLDIGLDAARRAGDAALQMFGRRIKVWRKADGTPVSEADLAVDRMLKDAFAAARPGDGWLSEETEDRDIAAGRRFWLADPIDGTAAFLGGEAQWCIALALIEDGRPTLGIIHAPALKATYTAAAGQGAWLNGTPIRVSDRAVLSEARVLANAATLRPERWTTPLPPVQRIATPSLALRLAAVAEGTSDAALALAPKHQWDLAAGDILVREAGGTMSDTGGCPIVYGSGDRSSPFIAANPLLHAELLARRPLPAT